MNESGSDRSTSSSSRRAVRFLGTSDVRRLLDELDLRPTKQRGQNFVTDANTVRRIVRVAGLTADDVVVEIGPGLGSLTLALFEVVDHVVAVEIDQTLAGRLPQTIAEQAPGAQIDLVVADAMSVVHLPVVPTAMVANLPYNVSVPVLLHFLETFASIRSILVMVQAEVAHRLAAAPGSKIYGVPSVKAAWWSEVTLAGNVGRTVFIPAPNVDSALVALRRRAEPLGDDELRRATFAVVDSAFAQRRKTLRSALAGLAGSPAAAEMALVAAGIDSQARGERLDVHDFVRIAQALRS